MPVTIQHNHGLLAHAAFGSKRCYCGICQYLHYNNHCRLTMNSCLVILVYPASVNWSTTHSAYNHSYVVKLV